MRISILLFLLIAACSINSFSKDKKTSNGVKYVYSPVSIQASYEASYFLSKGKGDLDMCTTFGHGMELLLKNRINKQYNLDIGFQAVNYKIDTSKLYQQLLSAYIKPGYYTTMKSLYSTGNMSQFGFSASFGKNIKLNDLKLEPYVKLGLSFFSYNTQTIVYVRNKTTSEFNFYTVDGKKQNATFIPAIGLRGNYKMTRILSLACGVEAGYVIGKHQVTASQTNQEDKTSNGLMSVATPKTYIGGSIGLTLTPFNRVRESEWKYNDENYLKNKEIGN